MRRRDFIALAGGAVAIAPFAARAQQAERMRLVGVLLPAAGDEAEMQARIAAFQQALQQLGWTIGRNVRIDTRWATADAAEIRRHAAELAALAPDVILAHAATTVGPLLQATRTVPVVFPAVVDPVGAGDAFCAGFICARLEGSDVPAALEMGNACGASAVSALGDLTGMPVRSAVDRLLANAAITDDTLR